MNPTYYPAWLNLQGRRALLLGGGQVAARKARSLLEAGALLKVVAPELDQAFAQLKEHPGFSCRPGRFEPADLDQVWLVVCATDDVQVNRQAAQEAEKRRIFVNVVDVPGLCSFIVPATVRRGSLSVGISTSGASPALAASLRRELEDYLGPEWPPLLKIMAQVRAKVLKRRPGQGQNQQIFTALAESELKTLVKNRQWLETEELLTRLLGPGFTLGELGLSLTDLEADA